MRAFARRHAGAPVRDGAPQRRRGMARLEVGAQLCGWAAGSGLGRVPCYGLRRRRWERGVGGGEGVGGVERESVS